MSTTRAIGENGRVHLDAADMALQPPAALGRYALAAIAQLRVVAAQAGLRL